LRQDACSEKRRREQPRLKRGKKKGAVEQLSPLPALGDACSLDTKNKPGKTRRSQEAEQTANTKKKKKKKKKEFR